MSSADAAISETRLADVPAGDRVRAATGRVGDADLAVADRDHDQQAADQDADLEPVGQRDDAAEDQDAQDLLGRVGRRRDGVRAEDRQRLLLRQALAELVLARERAPEEQAADRREELAGRRRRRAGRLLGGQLVLRPCSGSRGCAAVRPGPGGRPACVPAVVVRPPIIRRRRAAGRRGVRAGPPRGSTPRRPRSRTPPVPRSPSRRRCRGSGSSRAGRRRAAGRRCPG